MIRKIRKNKSDLCDGRQNAQGGLIILNEIETNSMHG